VINQVTMLSLLTTIKPHIEAGKTKLVNIFPASRMISHVVGEMFALWSLYGARYDEILVVVDDWARRMSTGKASRADHRLNQFPIDLATLG
jgi:hypothetical protein